MTGEKGLLSLPYNFKKAKLKLTFLLTFFLCPVILNFYTDF